MKEIVYVRRNEIFTDSGIIAEETNVKHINIKELIIDYESEFKDFGTLSVLNRESNGGRPEQYYALNEQQATFLLTLMRNSKKVVAFKLALVKEFYRMRQMLLQKSTKDWSEARQSGKRARLSETDEIKALVDYAIKAGSKNADNYYLHYTRLANGAVGLKDGQRDKATHEALKGLEAIEHLIKRTVEEEIEKGTDYHDIYKIAKSRVGVLTSLLYLPENPLLPTL